jgi:uncharacterized protein with PQ loop repeat
VGSILIAIFTLPQLISILKTKNTAHIHISMYVIFLIGCSCFFIGGFLMIFNTQGDDKDLASRLSSGLPLVIAQGTCGIISGIIFVYKMKNYFGAKKAKISELNYCHQLKKIADEYRKSVYMLSHQPHEGEEKKENK